MATIIWSIGVVGCFSYSDSGMSQKSLMALLERLYQTYPANHQVVVYEAATTEGGRFRADATTLAALPSVELDGASTLYIPPATATLPDWQRYFEFNFPASAVTELFQAPPPITGPSDHS